MPPGKVNDPQDEDQNSKVGYIERGDICINRIGVRYPVMIPYSTDAYPGFNRDQELQFVMARGTIIFPGNKRVPINIAINLFAVDPTDPFLPLDQRDPR